MIRVNLAENARRRTLGGRTAGSLPILPLMHALILAGTVLGGYLWYSNLSGKVHTLDANIQKETENLHKLDAVVKQNRLFETRKVALDARLKAVQRLRANQVSPVVSLDKLSDAVSRTNLPDRNPYVWLSRLEQSNVTFNMSGVSTSVLGVADFIANLEGTGYFKNIAQFSAQDAAGNYSFTLSCEYAPPRQAAAARPAGAN